MKGLKVLTVSLLTLTFSAGVFAVENKYKCIGENEISHSILLGSVKIQESNNKISSASVSITTEGGRVIFLKFRGPLKKPGERVSNKSVFLEGIDNSRIDPFADLNYLVLEGQFEKLKFSELPRTLDISVDSIFGPIGNRGSDSLSLECVLQ